MLREQLHFWGPTKLRWWYSCHLSSKIPFLRWTRGGLSPSPSPKIWHRKLSYGIFCKIVLMPSKVNGGRSLDLTVHTGAKVGAEVFFGRQDIHFCPSVYVFRETHKSSSNCCNLRNYALNLKMVDALILSWHFLLFVFYAFVLKSLVRASLVQITRPSTLAIFI